MDCFPQWLMAFDSIWTTERILGLYLLFNAFVQSLPDPDERSGMAYVFLFRFAHAIAMNINVVRKPVKAVNPNA